MLRRQWLLRTTHAIASISLTAHEVAARRVGEYSSPYRLRFRHPVADLASIDRIEPRSSTREQAAVPHREWYGEPVERRYGAWGPPARQYPAPPGLERRDATWLQDRVLLSASRWIGYPYQHHHIPDWEPPARWPWIKVAYGRNSRGIDCSNFSSFAYNYGLGIKLDTGIRQQAERRQVRGPGGRGVLTVGVVDRRPYAELVRDLRPADLLYIRNDAGRVAHVILWLGEVGAAADGMPLILDSTGTGHRDSDGVPIPLGVHIRPFSPSSWYARDFAHAHRIIPAIPDVEPGEAAEAEEGGAFSP